jgi:hypothetical protein
MVSDFRMSNERRPPVDFAITQPPNHKMIVKVSEPEIEYGGSFSWVDFNDDRGFDITEDTLRLANIKIRIEQSQDSNYHVAIKKYSHGRTTTEAEERAQRIGFNAAYKDSVLDVASGITIDKDSKFRAQQVVVVIQVPVNKKIRFDETVNKLHALSIRTDRDRRWHRYNGDFEINWDEYFDYETDVDYLMGKDGYLINPSKPAKKENDESQNQDSIERKNKKEQLKQELKKIEEQEKNDSLQKKSQTTKSETVDYVNKEEANTKISVYSPLSFAALFN